MELYYETPDKRAKLYLGDARRLNLIEDGAAHLVFADPPYKEEWPEGWFREAMRISNRTVLITPGIANTAFLPKPDWILGWIKRNARSRTQCGFNCWEPIYLYGWPGRPNLRDIYEFPIETGDDRAWHPYPKPLRLLRALVRDFSEEGDLVIDPFVGSGTTCIAAYHLGRRAIGIDINPEYLEMAKKPLLQGVLL